MTGVSDEEIKKITYLNAMLPTVSTPSAPAPRELHRGRPAGRGGDVDMRSRPGRARAAPKKTKASDLTGHPGLAAKP